MLIAKNAGILLFLVWNFGSLAWAQNVSQQKSVTQAGDLQEQLKTALQQQQVKLGELLPWQKILFQEEVLTNHQRFIKDYRASGRGVVADVDLSSIKNYLRFHASLLPTDQADAKSEQRALVFVSANKGCEKCAASEPEIRKQLKERLERRGLKVVSLPPEEVQGSSSAPAPQGRALDEKVIQLMKQGGAAAAAVARLDPVTADIDSAHADELHFKIHLTLAIRDMPRHDMDLDVLETGKFESAFARLATDAFVEVGSKQLLLGFQQGGGTQVFIEVTGFRDFEGYRNLLRGFQEKLGEAEPLIERKVSRASVTLVLRTARKKEEIQALLAEIPVSSLKWEVK